MSFVINKEQRESQKEQSYSLQQWLLRGEIQKAGAVSGLPSVFISWQSSSESLAATWHPDTQRDSHKHTGMHNDVHWFWGWLSQKHLQWFKGSNQPAPASF